MQDNEEQNPDNINKEKEITKVEDEEKKEEEIKEQENKEEEQENVNKEKEIEINEIDINKNQNELITQNQSENIKSDNIIFNEKNEIETQKDENNVINDDNEKEEIGNHILENQEQNKLYEDKKSGENKIIEKNESNEDSNNIEINEKNDINIILDNNINETENNNLFKKENNVNKNENNIADKNENNNEDINEKDDNINNKDENKNEKEQNEYTLLNNNENEIKEEIIDSKENDINKYQNQIIEEIEDPDPEPPPEPEIEIKESNNIGEEEISKNEINEIQNKNLDAKLLEKISEFTESNYKDFYIPKHFCDYNISNEWRPGYIISLSDDNVIIKDVFNKDDSEYKINIKDKNKIAYIRKYSKPDINMAKGTSKNLKNKLYQFLVFHKDFENYIKNCSNFDFYYFLRVTVYYGLDFCMNANNIENNADNVFLSFRFILSIMDIMIDCLKYIDKNIKDFIIFESSIRNTELNDMVLLDKKYSIFSFFDDIHFLLKKIFGDSSEYLDWYIINKKDIVKFNPSLNTKNINMKGINNDPIFNSMPLPLYNNEANDENGKILEKICVKEIYDNYQHIFHTLDKEINSGIIAYFVDYFSYYGGFKILFKLIYSLDAINVNNFLNIFDIQNKIVKDLFLVKAITNAFNESHSQEKINLEKYISNYLNKLDEKIFQKIAEKEFFSFFSIIFDLIETNDEKKKIMNEKVFVNYIFNKFLSEKKLDKKISFLCEINNIILSTEYNELELKIKNRKNNKELNAEMLNDSKFRERKKEINNITSEQFCKICHQKNIINYILNNNSHEEIIKRIYPIIKIMYINNFGYSGEEEMNSLNIKKLKMNLFKSLFQRLKEAEKNNEIIWKLIQDMIINFTECLSEDDKYEVFLLIKNYLNENIKVIKHNKVNQAFNFIIQFSLKSINDAKFKQNTKNKKDNEQIINENDNKEIKDIKENNLYCLDMLLELLIYEKKINELNINLTTEQKIELIDILIEGIMQLLQKINFNISIIKLIIEKILITIFKFINTTQSIILLEKLILKSDKIKEELQNYFSKKTEEETLKLINDFCSISLKNENLEEKNNKNEIYNIDLKLEKVLDFIFILFKSNININNNYENLNIFSIVFASNEKVKNIFYQKLKKNISNIIYPIKMFIFNKILLNPRSSYKIDDLPSYQLLKEFIINLNTQSNKFTYITKDEFIVLFEKVNDIFGYEKLFKLLLETKNIEIQSDIQNFISDIYLNVKYFSKEKYNNIWSEVVSNIVSHLKNLSKNKKDNNFAIKGIIGLLKNIIQKSSDDGRIITDLRLIKNLMNKIGQDFGQKNNEKKDNKSSKSNKSNNKEEKKENESIRIMLEYSYYKEDENQEKIIKNKKEKVKELIKEKRTDNIEKNEFFYYFRYFISFGFKIPLKCIQIELPKNCSDIPDENKKLNLFDDFFPLYDTLKNNFDFSKKTPPEILIKVHKIKNPLNDAKNVNIKNIIKSNSELLNILIDLLKNKNSDYTSDILEIVKDNDDFIKKGIFDDFDKLINHLDNNTNLLNDLFNFDDANIFFKNLILTNLSDFLQKEKNNIKKFINSKIWKDKIKNITINKSFDKEEIKFINNLLNIYIIVSSELKDGDINEEFINKKIFEIFIEIINNSLNDKNDISISYDMKNIYFSILESINNLYKNDSSLFISFIKLILKEKLIKDIKYCFIDGIVKNKIPFISDKIQEFIMVLIQNKIFINTNNKEDLKKLKKEFYIFISSLLFNKENNDYVVDIIKDFSNNMNDDNEDIYVYNIKSYYKILSQILYHIYKSNFKDIDYEKYIIESVIPYLYEPLLTKGKKISKLNDIFFGGQCTILCNYIQIMRKDLTEEQYNSLFNYNSKPLKKYLFDEIIMLNCQKDNYKNSVELKKSFNIIYSSKEVNHLFIALLLKDKDEDLMIYLEKIKNYNNLGYWRGDEESDWKLNSNNNERMEKSSDFIGLKNLGCTCYMNSLMQTFFNIITLRESLLRCKCKEKSKNVLYEIQKLFSSLKFCNESYYTPRSFVENYDNEKLNIHQQMDIDEFFSNLIDKLENRLKNTENENLIKYFFQGRLNDTLTFQEGCTHHRTNVSNFYSIQLQIRNKRSLYESLDTLIEGELMNEDNCIFCPECKKKMPAVKSQSFKILPRMLIFVLKRFEFDFNTMTKIKVNDYYEFPFDLDMNKYTGDYINNQNSEDTNIKVDNTYKLKSIVIHQGHCEGGHYYAFIRDDKTQEWHQFNDTMVTSFDVKNIPKEAFGGDSNKNAYLLFYEKNNVDNCENFEKINEIKKVIDNEELNEEIINDDKDKEKDNDNDENEFNLINESKNKKNKIEIKEDINKNEIDKEEIKNNLTKKLFSRDFHHLTLELFLNILYIIDSEGISDILYNENNNTKYNFIHPIEKQMNLHYKEKHLCQNLLKYIKEGKIKLFEIGNKAKEKLTEEEIMNKNILMFEYILLNYFNVVIRSKDRKYIGCYVDLLKSLVLHYEYCANYLLEEFSCYNVLMEYLKNCPLYEIKKLSVGIIDYAMNSSINFYKQNKGKNIKGKINSKILDKGKNKDKNKKKEVNEINENKINDNIASINSVETDNNMDDFEIIKDEEISEIKKLDKKNKTKKQISNKEDDDFELLDFEKEQRPSSKHYLEIMKENEENLEEMEDNCSDFDLIKTGSISPNVLKMIYNIIYVMKNIKFANIIESRFLVFVLLRFSLISHYTKNFLIENVNILLALNILSYQILRELNYTSSEVFDIGRDTLLKPEHQILNSQKGIIIKGEYDKYKNKNSNYHFMLLCSLLYNKESSLEEREKNNEDKGFSFYSKDYIVALIKSADSKQDINYLANLLSRKCYYDKDLFNVVMNSLNLIIEKINDSEDAFYDKYETDNNTEIYPNIKKKGYFLKRLRSNMHIILVNLFLPKNDGLDEYRQKEILNNLFSFFKDNKKYYGFDLYICNIILDIYCKGGESLKKKLSKLNDIKDWLEKNKIAPKLYEIKGIEMYKDTPIHPALYMNIKNLTEGNKKLKNDFDKAEIAKTKKKIELINQLMNEEFEYEKNNIDYYEGDFSRYNYYIGDKVFYGNKKYEILEVLDEMIKIKEIEIGENLENKFKVKGYKDKRKINKNIKENKGYWIESDDCKIRIILEN